MTCSLDVRRTDIEENEQQTNWIIIDVEVNLREIQIAFGLTIMKGSIFSKKLLTHPARENETETKIPQAGSGNKMVKTSVGPGFIVLWLLLNLIPGARS